jgi:hypothetical protein
MPIRTKIAVEADSEKFKASFATFEKYRTALKQLYGEQVERAPFIKAASDAGGQVLKFIDLDKAARSQTNFATAAQKAGHAFRGLGTGVVQTLEGFARIALSPLEILFPAGLAVGLLGLGAGLIGAGSLYGLERGAAGVSDRRRQAMGLGVSYGSLSAYDLNFSRFGVGQETLGAVAGGIYDFTSPEYLGLLSSGSTGHGDTSEAAIDLIRSIPEIFKNTPDQMVGPVARSHNLTSLLDMQSIIRLKNHPEEIEEQVERYRQDRKTLDISTGAQEKWASFNAAISRAGRDIETVLGKNLVALTPGLTKFSDDAVKFIDALIDSGTITNALKGIRSGLGWVEGALGSSEFKEGAKRFLSGLETLGPYIDRFVNGPLAKALLLAGRGLYYGADLFGNPNYNPSFWGLVGDVLGVRGQDAPGLTGTGNPSIRYHAGHGAERPRYGGVADPKTGKLLPRPEFKYSPKPGEGGGSGWNTSVGDIPADVLAKVQAANPNLSPRQCVELVQSTMGVGNVHDWRRGPSEKDSPAGAALATFGVHGDSNLYAYGGSGTPGIGRDHALKLVKKYPDGSFDAVSQDIGHAPHLIHMPWTGKGGEGDASSYFAIFNRSGPAGENSRLFNERRIALPARPPTPTPVHNWGPWHAGGTPSGPIIDDPSLASSGVDAALAESAEDRFAEMQRNRNRPLKFHGTHILDHMDKGPPPGPIVIHDMTGGSVNVSVSRHEATQ